MVEGIAAVARGHPVHQGADAVARRVVHILPALVADHRRIAGGEISPHQLAVGVVAVAPAALVAGFTRAPAQQVVGVHQRRHNRAGGVGIVDAQQLAGGVVAVAARGAVAVGLKDQPAIAIVEIAHQALVAAIP